MIQLNDYFFLLRPGFFLASESYKSYLKLVPNLYRGAVSGRYFYPYALIEIKLYLQGLVRCHCSLFGAVILETSNKYRNILRSSIFN